MPNDQVTAARGVMSGFPLLKVAIGSAGGGETITPYKVSDATDQGAAVTVGSETKPRDIESALIASCQALLNG